MKEIIEQLERLLEQNKVCVSFSWIGTETGAKEIWATTFMDEEKKIRIVVDLNRIVCFYVIHEFLHWVYPLLNENEINALNEQIYQSLSFEEKQKFVQTIKSNAKRNCQEIS